ncbi:MAG: DUF2490 domain-containing protein [Lentisphaeraceae bacterium]|nr:DUF2490 domain-containing protein [Lentisphaeraceae bacterium]
MQKNLFIFLLLLLGTTSQAENLLDDWKNLKDEFGLNLSSIYYFDDRDFNTLSVYTAAFKLPNNFSFWGFTDFHGNQNPPRNRAKFTNSFSEYRLIYNLKDLTGTDNFALELEYNYASLSDEHTLRFGPHFKHSIPFLPDGSWVIWRFFPIETSDNMELGWAWNFVITDKWSITGFADYNIEEGQQDRWIVEPQLNYQLNDNVSFHLEYRHNGFQDANKNLRGNGVAIGIGITF